MHELSIVTSIIKTAEYEVETTGGGKIVEIILVASFYLGTLCQGFYIRQLKSHYIRTGGKSKLCGM
jgi:Zn finger protein HypA/HybF involved in hydrogenase expression